MMLSDVWLSDVCLFVAYIASKSRTERPRKTKIGAEVAPTSHVTRTPLSRSVGQRSRSRTRRGHIVAASRLQLVYLGRCTVVTYAVDWSYSADELQSNESYETTGRRHDIPRPCLQVDVVTRYTSCTHMDRSPLLYVHVGLRVQPTKAAW